jgi:hypothetical protein
VFVGEDSIGAAKWRGSVMFKRFIVIFTGLLIVCQFALTEVRFGVQAGTNIGSLSGADNWTWRGRILGGACADVELSEHFQLAVQVNYCEKWTSRRGFLDGDPPSHDLRISIMQRYIDLPVYLRWRSSRSGLRWFGEVGPSWGRMVSSNVEWAEPGFTTIQSGSWEGFNRTDFSIVVGGGVEYSLWNATTVNLSMHYAHALTEAFTAGETVRRLGLQIALGFMFVPYQ